MSQQQTTEDLIVTVEEGAVDIEDGDTCQGVIAGTSTHTWTSPEDGDVLYFDVKIRESTTDIEMSTGFPAGQPSNPRITKTTELGQLVSRFNGGFAIDEQINLGEVFQPGTEVEFEVERDSEPDEDGNRYLNPVRESIRPLGSSDGEVATQAPQDDSGQTGDSESEADETEAEVISIIADNLGESERDIKRELASNGSAYIQAYKSLIEEGVVEVSDGSVSIA